MQISGMDAIERAVSIRGYLFPAAVFAIAAGGTGKEKDPPGFGPKIGDIDTVLHILAKAVVDNVKGNNQVEIVTGEEAG